MKDPKALAREMRNHVESRGGPAKDKDGNIIIENGAWSMMLEAAELLEKVEDAIDEIVDGGFGSPHPIDIAEGIRKEYENGK